MPYAARTRLPISRMKTDIKELLAKHGATGFAYALSWQTSVQSLPSRRLGILGTGESSVWRWRPNCYLTRQPIGR